MLYCVVEFSKAEIADLACRHIPPAGLVKLWVVVALLDVHAKS
jgi:hypothetical protein